jgi:uncharacterized membrane protein YccF (DUF307 family)
MAATVASALNSVKSGIWAFWAGVVLAVIALVGGIIGAVTASGTIVGIPVGVAAAILAVVGFLGAAGAGVLVLVNQCGDAADSLRTAQAYVDPWPTFA